MLEISILLSIFIGFIFNGLFSLLSGGLVSAGYLSLYLEEPLRVVMTIALSLVVFLLMILIKKYAIIFGRRRFALTMLLSIILSSLLEILLSYKLSFPIDLRIIGYIIPGLIANDMQKQGIIRTLITVFLIATVIWLFVHLGSYL